MSFVTYSQNFEDLMLWRALKNVEKGFYIDVGANDPQQDSVTKAFYDMGWRGINIEPEYQFYKALKKERLRDINLHCAISSSQKQITLYVSKLRGWSTTDSAVSSKQKEKKLLDEAIIVEARTLDDVMMQNKEHFSEVHFLKIDVEGAEKDVLESFSFLHVRPWIIVVESTLQGTHEDISNSWEHLILKNNYFQVYFDGINKYYLAQEKSSLSSAFAYPPNVLDDWIHIDHKHVLENEQRLKKMAEQNDELRHTIKTLEEAYTNLLYLYESVLSSKSWKITKPLRSFISFLKKSKKTQENSSQEALQSPKKQKTIPFHYRHLSKEAKSIYEDLK